MHFVSIWRKVICIESSYGLAIFCTAFSSLRKIVCFVPISVSYIIWGNALWTRRPYQELALDHRVGWCGSTENDQFTAILTIFFIGIRLLSQPQYSSHPYLKVSLAFHCKCKATECHSIKNQKTMLQKSGEYKS